MTPAPVGTPSDTPTTAGVPNATTAGGSAEDLGVSRSTFLHHVNNAEGVPAENAFDRRPARCPRM